MNILLMNMETIMLFLFLSNDICVIIHIHRESTLNIFLMMMAAAHLSNTKPEDANTVRVLFSMSYIQLPHIQNARISN